MQETKLTAQIADSNYPDLGHRLLAAAKVWTVIDYFFAYKELMDDDWEAVFRKSIPDFATASDSLEYALAVARMYTHLDDGHGFIRSTALRQYFGRTVPPVFIRFIDDKPVVTCILPDSVYEVKGVDIGDIILEIDGERTDDRIERFSEYINASNRPTLLNYISWRILNGPDSSEIRLKIQKVNGKIENVTLPRRKAFAEAAGVCDDVESPITRLINPEIGYADLDRLTSEMVDKMFEDFKETKAIIFDMRGYPNGTAWSIAPHLTDKKEVYGASFRRYAPMGIQTGHASHLTLFDQPLPSPRAPYYQGKTVMLIDERTQSQAEHTGLFFEAANGTKFIGSQTAGANGDVTNFAIPGQITLFFSGHDVRHADGRQLQRIGLVPDVLVKPTIKGIVEGKDEVLEKAIEYVEKLIVE
jgi:C-terminal processing protease CtpA/Prc